MGRASNRKKARHKTSFRPWRTMPGFQAEGKRQVRLLAGMQVAERLYAQACKVWGGGSEPVQARMPWWAHGALGREFTANPFVAEAQKAPCLATAVVPPAAVIHDDPTHWHVAANVLIRAVVFDGLDAGHPAVSALLGTLAPVAETELRCWPEVQSWLLSEESQRNQPAPGFPVLDGPVALVAMYVLAAAAGTVIGSNPGSEELAVISRALDDVIPGVAGSVVTEVLIQEVNPLAALAASGAVQPREVLGTGLAALQALIRIFETEAALMPGEVA
jgi:hypothetical protein